MYTQCPECHIAFRVTVQVLQQAGGRVQCGGCNNPFNAVDYLSDEPPTSDAEQDLDSIVSPVVSEAMAIEVDEYSEDGSTDDTGENDSAPSFEERNTQLLKALDELAGPEEELRIEDTGVEWRVVGQGQELADEAVEKAVPTREQRYDDSTPLPDDFGEEDHDDSSTAPTSWSSSSDSADKESEELPLLEDAQVDLTLDDPDEWLDLLDDVLDQQTLASGDDDMATVAEQRELLNDTSNAALRMEAEEELAAIHNELSSTPEPFAATAENVNTPGEEDLEEIELASAAKESIAVAGDPVTGDEKDADDQPDLVNPEQARPGDDSDTGAGVEDAFGTDADADDPEENSMENDADSVHLQEYPSGDDAGAIDVEEYAQEADVSAVDMKNDDVDAIDAEINPPDDAADATEPEADQLEEDVLQDDVNRIDLEENLWDADAIEAEVAELEVKEGTVDPQEDVPEEHEDAVDLEEEALAEDSEEDLFSVAEHDELADEDREATQTSEDEPADDRQATENSAGDPADIDLEISDVDDADGSNKDGEDEDLLTDDFRSQIALIEDSLADELLEGDESAQDSDGDETVIAETEVEEHEIEKELSTPSEQASFTDESTPKSTDHTLDSQIHDDMRRAMEDDQFAATMVGEDGSPMIETIIMEGDFVRGSIERAPDDAETNLPGDLEEPKSLIDTYVLSRRRTSGTRFLGTPGRGTAAGIVILLLVLAGQYIHSSREYLATLGMFNQTIGPVYRALGRPVTPAWDIKGWQFETTNGSTDEDEQLLTIYSSVSNRSSRALPYPLVYVSLTDRWEEIIGSRVLEPSEYLAGNPDPSKPVAPGNKFTAVISIATPPAEVTGFKLNVCYRVGPGQLSCAIEDFK